VALSATAIAVVLGISGIAVANVLADAPDPPKIEYLSNAAMMASAAGTGVGDSSGPSTAAASEVDVTGISFTDPDKAAKLFAMPDETSEAVVAIAPRSQVGITGTTHEGFTQVAYADKVGWVRTNSLVTGGPLSSGPCASGNGVEKGLQPDTIRVHRVACAAFPQVTRYGGVGGGGEHATGQALDIMTKDVQLGTIIAIFMREHAAELGVSQVIWRQHIWTVQMAGGGWRAMESRGSPTANHMDHVHVTTYGNRGTL
jgi:hypothetical protein